MIQNEGVDSLSEAELRQACRERGMLGLRSVEDMRKQVRFLPISVYFSPRPLYFSSFSFKISSQNWIHDRFVELSCDFASDTDSLTLVN